MYRHKKKDISYCVYNVFFWFFRHQTYHEDDNNYPGRYGQRYQSSNVTIYLVELDDFTLGSSKKSALPYISKVSLPSSAIKFAVFFVATKNCVDYP